MGRNYDIGDCFQNKDSKHIYKLLSYDMIKHYVKLGGCHKVNNDDYIEGGIVCVPLGLFEVNYELVNKEVVELLYGGN